MADEIVKTLNRRMAASAGESLAITASVGVAISDGLTDTELLAYADLAMYEAKEAGRNRFAVYRAVKGDRVSARLAEAERIRHALEENALLLYGQPVLDFQTNTLHNYELLVRLPGDNGSEPLLPSAFLYVAERFGLIQAVDAWVVRKAIRLIADHTRSGRDLVLSVNVSGKSICDPRLAPDIEDALDEAAIDPGRLIFELTETAAIGHFEQARTFATRLGRRGCRFALDDSARVRVVLLPQEFPVRLHQIDGASSANCLESHGSARVQPSCRSRRARQENRRRVRRRSEHRRSFKGSASTVPRVFHREPRRRGGSQDRPTLLARCDSASGDEPPLHHPVPSFPFVAVSPRRRQERIRPQGAVSIQWAAAEKCRARAPMGAGSRC